MASGSSSSSSSSIPMSIFSPTPTVNSSNGDSGVHNVSESISPTSAIAENDKSDDETLATSATAIQKAFREMVNDPEHLEEAANYMYESLLDDAVVGVALETHHLRKTGNLPALEGIPEGKSDTSYRIVDLPNYDIFDVSTAKKPMMVCTCPICDRPVSATRFAPHLTNCMGMGRTSSRIASRRLATKEGTGASSSSSSYLQANAATDDEDDADWSSEKRRKKSNQNSRNGSKKNNNNKTF